MKKNEKITMKEAKLIAKSTGIDIGGEDDGRTFYATNITRDCVFSFDTKKERDKFCGLS